MSLRNGSRHLSEEDRYHILYDLGYIIYNIILILYSNHTAKKYLEFRKKIMVVRVIVLGKKSINVRRRVGTAEMVKNG